MQANKLFEEGGILQEGGTIDPVSGNDVPVGSLQEEVRDDLDVKLSEGEFVIPADVVRYIGLERLMQLRDEAKKGLARMAEIGQMGNAQEVENPDQLHGGGDDEEEYSGDFDSEIDDIISEVDAEALGQERQSYTGGMVKMNVGGAVPSATGSGPLPMLSKYGVPTSSVSNPALDVRVYSNAAGSKMFVTFINGKPLSPIPSGFTYSGEGTEYGNPPAPVFESTRPPAPTPAPTPAPSPAPADGGGADGGTGGDAGGGPGSGGGSTTGGTTGSTGIGSVSIGPTGVATANTTGISNAVAGLAGLAASTVTGIPGLSTIATAINNAVNNAATAAAASVNAAVADTTAAANVADSTTAAATAGPSGTGGTAAAAAAAAASAATTDGHSAAAAAAAGQAAANAAVNGASMSAAIDAGLAAAQAVSDAEGAAAAAAATVGTATDDGTTEGISAAADAAAVGEGNTSAEGTSGAGADAGAAGIGADGVGGTGTGVGGDNARGGLIVRRNKKSSKMVQKGLAARK